MYTSDFHVAWRLEVLVRTLIALSGRSQQRRFGRLLEEQQSLVTALEKAGDLWARLAGERFDFLVISRDVLPNPAVGSINAIRQLPDGPEVAVVSDREDPEERARMLAAGCLAVIYSGLDDGVIGETLGSLIRRHREEAVRRLKTAGETPRLGDFVSASRPMQELLAVSRRTVPSDTSLLIVGQTGVGKEWLARAIHEEGPRASGPFIAINCGAIPESLLESELFGHEEGAFTGARRAHRGYFELAHKGTVFLDEIAEMPAHLQVKLLRVLQERRIQRVGAESKIDVDVRIMAATNRDLHEEIRAKRFRPDLYYRIGVVTLEIPPLQERKEDIPELARTYLEIFQVRLGRSGRRISDLAMAALIEYAWPGNVRELINVMERAVLLCVGGEIGLHDLPENIRGKEAGGFEIPDSGLQLSPFWLSKPLRDARREIVTAFEKEYLRSLLQENRGRVGRTAEHAGITPRSLFEKMQRYGLRKESFRS